MTDMKKKADKKRNRRGRPSLFVGLLNRFFAFIYSLFIFALPGRMLSGSDGFFKKSFIGGVLSEGSLSGRRKNGRKSLAEILSQSFVSRMATRTRTSFLTMSANVYGLFFVVFGVASVLAYYTSLLLKGNYAYGISGPITGGIVAVCAIPLLMSSASTAELIRSGRILRPFVIDFLGVPEEKIKSDIRTGGTAYLLSAAALGLVLGALSFFCHPLILPICCIAILALCIIASCPEAGVVITVTVMPFLQYFDNSDVVLIGLVLVTLLSYIFKIKKRKRTRTVAPAGIMVMLYCVSVLISGSFTDGGWRTFLDSLINVLVISGAYFLSFNLINSTKKLKVCISVLSVTLVIFSLIGIWNTYYGYVSGGIIYSVGDRLGTVISQNPLYLADSAGVFGLFAVIISPTLVATCFNRERIYRVAMLIICIFSVLMGMVLFGTYEALVALCIGVCLYLVFYSHKTLTSLLLIAVPVAALLIVYPYIAVRLGADTNILSAVKGYFPAAAEDSGIRRQLFGSVIEMLKDGNLSGIGSGDLAFTNSFGSYANAVTSSADDPGSLYLLILCQSGVLGLVIFAGFVMLLLRSSFGYVMRAEKGKHRAITLALLCGLISALLLGMVNVLWGNIESLYLFWACAGLLSGCVKVGKEEAEKKNAFYAEEPTGTDVRVQFGK